MVIKYFKPIGVLTNPKIVEYEFNMQRGSERALKGAIILMFMPVVAVMGVGAVSIAKAKHEVRTVVNPTVRKSFNRVFNDLEIKEDHSPKVVDCGWHLC